MKPTDTRDRVRAVRVAILAEERRLRTRHPWLARQDVLGLACFLLSLAGMAGVAGAYVAGALRWWLAIPLMDLPLSVLHEVEHDLLFTVIWFCKLGLNPWYRRGIHLRHHRDSGQATDIEERLIGIGLPLGWLRLLVALHLFGSLVLFPRLRRDPPTFAPAAWSSCRCPRTRSSPPCGSASRPTSGSARAPACPRGAGSGSAA